MLRRLPRIFSFIALVGLAGLVWSSALSAAGSAAGIAAPALTVVGARDLTLPAPEKIRSVDGPTADLPGFAARETGGGVVARGVLDQPVNGHGSLAFWFRTDRAWRSGRGAPARTQKLVGIEDTLTVSFVAEPSAVTLLVEWGGKKEEMSDRYIRIILPEFPGPAWHHLALYWGGPSGEVNAYLDGTPYYVPGEKIAPLATLPGKTVSLYLSSMALAGVQIRPAPFDPAELRSLVGPEKFGALDGLLGARELGALEAASRRGSKIYARALTAPGDIAGWKLEGPGIVEFRDGWMQMKSQRPDGPQGHLVNWCPENFPDRFMAEWDFELLAEKGLCILFFAANGQGQRDLFDPSLKPRQGVFDQYTNGDIDCYHISYFANTPNEPRRVANLRKNAGFYLISNGPVGVPKVTLGEAHHALLIKDGAHVQMAVDGHKIIDYTDDGQRAGPVWGAGKIGFRQMQWTSARYRNFAVYNLK